MIKDGQDFASDTLVGRNGDWYEVRNDGNSKFLAEGWVVTDQAGYICAKNGAILKVTTQSIAELEVPGKCEALASTTSHSLLGSFRGMGIYEYNEKWTLRAAHPEPSSAGEYWTFLSDNGSVMALAIGGNPGIYSIPLERTNHHRYRLRTIAVNRNCSTFQRQRPRVAKEQWPDSFDISATQRPSGENRERWSAERLHLAVPQPQNPDVKFRCGDGEVRANDGSPALC